MSGGGTGGPVPVPDRDGPVPGADVAPGAAARGPGVAPAEALGPRRAAAIGAVHGVGSVGHLPRHVELRRPVHGGAAPARRDGHRGAGVLHRDPDLHAADARGGAQRHRRFDTRTTLGTEPLMPIYPTLALLAAGAVVALELIVVRTGLFTSIAYWITMAISLAFMIPVDGW